MITLALAVFAAFLLGLRAGIAIGYRGAKRELARTVGSGGKSW
jgi:hypothetical protein